ncbi:MAG: hypothetical protein ACQETQ_08575 [Spirochaetota bacterium]
MSEASSITNPRVVVRRLRIFLPISVGISVLVAFLTTGKGELLRLEALGTILIGWRFIDFYFTAILTLIVPGLEQFLSTRRARQ